MGPKLNVRDRFPDRPRYLKKKEEECEPPKVTLQIWPKGIKLVADSLRHMVPSHAVTYVSQGLPPEDDIVSVILLLYNPITKCPVHLHAYRCDSVETADLLRQQLQVMTRQTQPQSTQPLGSAVLNLCVRRRRTTERRPDLFFFLPRTISPTVSVAKKRVQMGSPSRNEIGKNHDSKLSFMVRFLWILISKTGFKFVEVRFFSLIRSGRGNCVYLNHKKKFKTIGVENVRSSRFDTAIIDF